MPDFLWWQIYTLRFYDTGWDYKRGLRQVGALTVGTTGFTTVGGQDSRVRRVNYLESGSRKWPQVESRSECWWGTPKTSLRRIGFWEGEGFGTNQTLYLLKVSGIFWLTLKVTLIDVWKGCRKIVLNVRSLCFHFPLLIPPWEVTPRGGVPLWRKSLRRSGHEKVTLCETRVSMFFRSTPDWSVGQVYVCEWVRDETWYRTRSTKSEIIGKFRVSECCVT